MDMVSSASALVTIPSNDLTDILRGQGVDSARVQEGLEDRFGQVSD